jgi:hypothetical protein
MNADQHGWSCGHLTSEDAQAELDRFGCPNEEYYDEFWGGYYAFQDDRDEDEDWDEYEEWYDGQPDEYTEWQDYMGGDDWDHGQYDEAY